VQPWARQLQKEIDDLKSIFQSAEVNNTTRDDQLASSLRQVQTAANNATQAAADAADAAQDALDAINGLTGLGSPGSSYSVDGANLVANTVTATHIASNTITANEINSGYVYAGQIDADQINAGTIDGLTITGGSLNTSPSSGRSVEISSSSARFKYNGSQVGEATADSVGRLLLSGNSGLYLNGGASGSGHFGSGGFYIYDGGVLSASGSLTRTQLIGGGTTGASITNGGNFVRTSSSQRYKTDIQLLEIDLNDLYALEPKTFKRIEEVEEDGENARVYPGLIAEELAGTSLDKFVFYSEDEDGNPQPEGIHYPELTAALLLAVQDLNARITTLEG
jgi:hypothetical protein